MPERNVTFFYLSLWKGVDARIANRSEKSESRQIMMSSLKKFKMTYLFYRNSPTQALLIPESVFFPIRIMSRCVNAL